MHRIFVYGSLMRGQANQEFLSKSRLIGAVKTLPRYTLVDLGPYPALLEGGATAVLGEVYEVDVATLRKLDQLEEHPHVYERRPVILESSEPAEAYVLHPHLRRGAPEIASGNWANLGVKGSRRS